MKHIEMTSTQWAAVRDNPRQRDTHAHAAKATRRGGHLTKLSPVHASVAAAELPGGDLVKLDGHTRSLLWSDGRLSAPAVLSVTVYPVGSLDEAKALYTTFDSASSAEGAKDRLAGAYRESGINPKSTLLKQGGMTSALSSLHRGGVYEAVAAWRSEILALDSLQTHKKALPGGAVLGALAILRKRRDFAMEFLALVVTDAGSRVPDGSCGIDAICRHLKTKPQSGEAAKLDTAERFIGAFEGWLSGKLFKNSPRRVSLSEYLGDRHE